MPPKGSHDGVATIVDFYSRRIIKEIASPDDNNNNNTTLVSSRRTQCVSYLNNSNHLAIGGADNMCYVHDKTNNKHDMMYEHKIDDHMTCIS